MKEALYEFIEPYMNDKDVEAILLVGSYAVGNENDLSDIDVYIILNDNVKYRCRGNKLVKGYLIEYFVNPLNKVIGYLKNDRRGHGGAMANMIVNGKVLYDKNNIIPKLKRKARYYKNKENKKVNKMLYYAAWDAYDEYKAAMYHRDLQYFICLERLIEAYLINNNYNMVPILKVEKMLRNKEYRDKYKIGNLPENEFNNLVINCFDEIEENNLDKLYHYVIDGNFDINNFENREKI